MKRTYLFFCALCAIAAVVVFSCKKNKTTTPNTTNLNQLFSGLRTNPQTLTVTAGRDTVVYASNGTMLHFYTYSFMDGQGSIIKSGTVSIQIIEMYTPGDMILNRATTTTTDSSQLQSGGQVKIVAYIGTTQVYANKYAIGFKQPSASTQPMNLFYGNTNNPDSVTKWTVSDTTKKGTQTKGTTADTSTIPNNPNFYYIFDSCTKFDWINCDYYMEKGSSLTSMTVTVPDNTFSELNTQVHIIFPDDKTTMEFKSYNSSANTFTNVIPIGKNYEVVVITNKNGSYYYYSGKGTITTSINISAAMVTETEADVIARMHAL